MPPRGSVDVAPNRRSSFRGVSDPPKKKAARFPERPFLSYGSSTLTGDFGTSAPGAYLPAAFLLGSRCKSGQSRTVTRTVAMVSHLRKMERLSRESAWTRKHAATNIPAVHRRSRRGSNYSASGRPRLIVAGGRGTATARQRRAGRTVGRRCPRHVGDMRLFPFMRLIGFFGRRDIDGVMQPAMP